MLRTSEVIVREFKKCSGWKDLSTEELAQLKRTMLGIADDFVSFCDRHGLKYCMAYGTALGAVRHNGFIPWDDDMDFFMPREDYQRFLETSESELGEKYVIKSVSKGDKVGFPTIHIRLKGTRYVNYGDMVMTRDEPEEDRGIYIDIAPLDNSNDVTFFRNAKGTLALGILFVGSCITTRDTARVLKKLNRVLSQEFKKAVQLKYWLGCIFGLIPLHLWIRFYDKLVTNNNMKSQYLTSYCGMKNLRKGTYRRHDIYPFVPGTFEERTWLLPHNSDAYLTIEYGNYMTLPAPENRRTHPVFELQFSNNIRLWGAGEKYVSKKVNYKMKALILAAGFGSRLAPLTDNLPKSLVPVNGKPILFKQIENLLDNNITDITIISGYKADVLERAVHEKWPEVRILESIEYATTNNMYSAYLGREIMDGSPFLMMNADVFFDSSVISALLNFEGDNAIVTDIGRYIEESMKVVEENGRLVKISKAILQDEALGSSIDVYKFSADGGTEFFAKCADYIKKRHERKLWSEVALNDVLAEGKISFKACPLSGRWVEIDNHDDLAEARNLFSEEPLDYFGISLNLKTKKLWLLDMDGTIYKEGSLFDGTLELLDSIIKQGGRYVFITNNSSKSVNDYITVVNNMGIKANEENFFTSTQATVFYLKKYFPTARVYCQGTKSFVQELTKAGINVTEEVKEVDVVLVGFDTELSMDKLRKTCELLTTGSPAYLATNPDLVCPVSFGFIPDCGSMCAMIRNATNKMPVYIGKPDPLMLNLAVERFGADKESTVVIGDRLYTDIAAGLNAGISAICVLTGEASIEDIKNGDIKPTWTFSSVKEINAVISGGG